MHMLLGGGGRDDGDAGQRLHLRLRHLRLRLDVADYRLEPAADAAGDEDDLAPVALLAPTEEPRQ